MTTVIYVVTDDVTKKKLIDLAEQDLRSAQAEVAWLIQQEWERRKSNNLLIQVPDKDDTQSCENL